jgi:hypothetical protein
VRLQGFLARNGYPHQLCDPAEDRDARRSSSVMRQTLRTCPWWSVQKGPCSRIRARLISRIALA